MTMTPPEAIGYVLPGTPARRTHMRSATVPTADEPAITLLLTTRRVDWLAFRVNDSASSSVCATALDGCAADAVGMSPAYVADKLTSMLLEPLGVQGDDVRGLAPGSAGRRPRGPFGGPV